MVNKNKNLSILLVVLSVILAGCQGAESGFAPGAAPAPSEPTVDAGESSVKYGEVVTTSNNWQVALDTSDATEQQVLPNGWTVEVKYE